MFGVLGRFFLLFAGRQGACKMGARRSLAAESRAVTWIGVELKGRLSGPLRDWVEEGHFQLELGLMEDRNLRNVGESGPLQCCSSRLVALVVLDRRRMLTLAPNRAVWGC